ncbi:hypothetical protein NQ317_003481 [Molorchus minor]|uniref:15-hydroxyprostaglandin dehydrogenase [NAD(+)]-like n=1 Tax=Molorchus minor TaxID=1323400 RepID=A0ABQ9JZE5_9CUCU|nr:hypothetical protein NQ317_003481 [Molorchus minor]
MALYRFRCISRYIQPPAATLVKMKHSSQSASTSESKKTKLENKVAVVTGGGSGIGYAIAKQFLKEGMCGVTVIDMDKQKALKGIQKLADEFGEDKVIFIEADVANSRQMDLAFKNTVFHYDTIDIIVNNAGIMDDTHWENQIKTNIHGCIIGTLLGMQYMAKSSSGEGGTIVNVGSVISIVPSSGFPIYTMTQFGIVGNTLQMASRRFTNALGSSNLYERTGVKVFGFCPGLTDTKLMKDVSAVSINDNFAREFQEEIDGCVLQKPQSVAKGLATILEDAKPGSIWIVENNTEPYEIKFPNVSRSNYKKIEYQ